MLQGFPSSLLDLVKKMFMRNPADRPTVQEILKHGFFHGTLVWPSLSANPSPSASTTTSRTPWHHQVQDKLVMASENRLLATNLSNPVHQAISLSAAVPLGIVMGNDTSSLTIPAPSASRYRSDFEEIEFLGKGGFGEVVKVSRSF